MVVVVGDRGVQVSSCVVVRSRKTLETFRRCLIQQNDLPSIKVSLSFLNRLDSEHKQVRTSDKGSNL